MPLPVEGQFVENGQRESSSPILKRWLGLISDGSVPALEPLSLVQLNALLEKLLEAASVERDAPTENLRGDNELTSQLKSQVDRLVAAYDRFGHSFGLVLIVCRQNNEPPLQFSRQRQQNELEDLLSEVTEQIRTVDSAYPAGPNTVALLLPESNADQTASASRRIVASLNESGSKRHLREVSVNCPEDGVSGDHLLQLSRRLLDEKVEQISTKRDGRHLRLTA